MFKKNLIFKDQKVWENDPSVLEAFSIAVNRSISIYDVEKTEATNYNNKPETITTKVNLIRLSIPNSNETYYLRLYSLGEIVESENFLRIQIDEKRIYLVLVSIKQIKDDLKQYKLNLDELENLLIIPKLPQSNYFKLLKSSESSIFRFDLSPDGKEKIYTDLNKTYGIYLLYTEPPQALKGKIEQGRAIGIIRGTKDYEICFRHENKFKKKTFSGAQFKEVLESIEINPFDEKLLEDELYKSVLLNNDVDLKRDYWWSMGRMVMSSAPHYGIFSQFFNQKKHSFNLIDQIFSSLATERERILESIDLLGELTRFIKGLEGIKSDFIGNLKTLVSPDLLWPFSKNFDQNKTKVLNYLISTQLDKFTKSTNGLRLLTRLMLLFNLDILDNNNKKNRRFLLGCKHEASKKFNDAFDCYKKSSWEDNNPYETYQLARCFYYGIGTEVDYEQAKMLSKKSKKMGLVAMR